MPIRLSRATAPLVLVAVAVLTAACGGSSSSVGGSDAIVADVDGLCRSASRALKKIDPSDPEVAFADASKVVATLSSGLSDLKPTSAVKLGVEALIGDADDAADALDRAATRTAKGRSADAAVADATSAVADLADEADGLGASRCDLVDAVAAVVASDVAGPVDTGSVDTGPVDTGGSAGPVITLDLPQASTPVEPVSPVGSDPPGSDPVPSGGITSVERIDLSDFSDPVGYSLATLAKDQQDFLLGGIFGDDPIVGELTGVGIIAVADSNGNIIGLMILGQASGNMPEAWLTIDCKDAGTVVTTSTGMQGYGCESSFSTILGGSTGYLVVTLDGAGLTPVELADLLKAANSRSL